MDEDPEPGKLPAAASEDLERRPSREDRISDLIAFLAVLDLLAGRARGRREVRLGGQAGTRTSS